MRSAVWVVNINDYFPELCSLTLPTIEKYAKRIKADFNLITERKFPEFPVPYEKLQIHELGKNYDWNILIDADVLIHKDIPVEITSFPPNQIFIDAGYEANTRFIFDDYFLRDGRNRGITTYFVAANKMCHDIWTPLEFSAMETKKNITRWHIADEYCISRNLARYGLKYKGLLDTDKRWMLQHIGVQDKNDFEKKKSLERAIKILRGWNG